jgi:hypothetical protein
VIIGDKLKTLEEWRADSWKREDLERANREDINKRMEALQDEIFVLKKGRNDAYH